MTTALTTRDRAWFERRLDGFGGSEAPAAVGISRWTPKRVLVETKARRIIPDVGGPERLRLRIGRDMEPMLLRHLGEYVEELEGRFPRIRRSSKLWRSPTWPFMTANVDGFAGDHDEDLIEIKTDEYGYEAWGEEDDDWRRSVPAFYACQVQHSLEATQRERGLLFVQIGLHEQRLYRIPRDEGYIRDLAEIEGNAWDLVVAIRLRLLEDPEADIDDLLPPVDGSRAATEYLRKRYPRSTDLVLQATPDQEKLIGRLRQARAVRRGAEAQEAEVENLVKDLIGSAGGISSGIGSVTWKSAKDGEDVDHEAIAALYRTLLEEALSGSNRQRMIRRLERTIPQARVLGAYPTTGKALDQLEALHRAPKTGSRRLLVPRSWDR